MSYWHKTNPKRWTGRDSLCVELWRDDLHGPDEHGEGWVDADYERVEQAVQEAVNCAIDATSMWVDAVELEIVYEYDGLAYRGTTPGNGPDPDELLAENHRLVRVELHDITSTGDPMRLPLTDEQQKAVWAVYQDRIESIVPEVPSDEQ